MHHVFSLPMKLKDLLKDALSDEELDQLVQSFDLVGDIAITQSPAELSHRQKLIGEAILATNKRIKVVARRDGFYQGDYRTIPLAIIAGEDRKETEHVEFGVRLQLNPELVYFSVRSSTERKRIAGLVKPGEDILVMFSGIAPYPLIINKFSQARSIVGIESNPVAHNYGTRNLLLNKVKDSVELFCGDVTEVVPEIDRQFQRIIMPLPTASKDYLPVALEFLSPGGTIHFYDFQPVGSFSASLDTVNQLCRDSGRRVLSSSPVVCGHTSPGISRVCLDTMIG
ncbi:MAG: class I SAM-dependent methyltransferase [Desulforhopalus sp.]